MNKSSLLKQVSLVLGSSLLMTGCVYRTEVRYRNPPPPPPPVAVVAPGAEVEVSGAPPVDIVEVQTPQPAVGFVWVGGFWGWGPRGWVWTSGRWAHPPRPGAVWIGSRYVYRGGRHVWVRGGWR